jgi:purine nucleosidase
MVRRKLIIDTDCGGDDAIGILAALTHPDVEVIAITVVWGNVNVDQGMENIGKILDLFAADIPFYRGASGPLLGDRETVQWGGFGEDGFGDAGFPPSMRIAHQSTKHAAIALGEILSNISVMEEDDEVYQLLCLGPLSNVALALRLFPDLFKNLGSKEFPGVVVMGGTNEGKGNSSMASEFNFHCDPEAARIVFQERPSRFPISLVSWELTVACAMPWRFFDDWISRINAADGKRKSVNQNRIQTFIEKVFQRLEVFTRPADDGTKADTGDAESTQDVTCVIPDAVAVCVALEPAIVLDQFHTYVTIELQGRETRGATLIDWYGTEQSMAKKGRWRNCNVVTKCSQEHFLKMMTAVVEYSI